MYLLWLIFTTLSLIKAEGFLPDTLLWTVDGVKSVKEITTNDRLTGTKDDQPIVQIFHSFVTEYVQLTVNQDIIACAKDQLFWCNNKDCWQKASGLIIGDQLLTIDNQTIMINSVELVSQPADVYACTIGPPHILLIGRSGFIAHNLVPAIGAGLLWSLGGSTAIEFVGATFYVGFVAAGVFIGTHFFKEKKKQPACTLMVTPQSNGGPSFNPNKNDDEEKKHPHGKYVEADYHHAQSKGIKSPAPKNGQKALDISIEVPGSNQRVSVCDGEIVILKRTAPREYHGYTITWNQLKAGAAGYENIRNTLQAIGFISKKGKLLI